MHLGDVEIIDPGPGEVVHRYIDPHLREKLEQGQVPEISYFYRDQLDSLQLIADATGGEDLERVYQPFGVETEYVVDPVALPEDFGFIGERQDKAAGLHYLNARYYDPELSMFIQPDSPNGW